MAVLGPFLASQGDQTLNHFRTKSVQALLVYLLVEGRAQPREWLAELLWPGLPPASGRKNLRQTLYELRLLIPEVAARDGGEAVPFLLADRQTAQVNPVASVFLDTEAFDRYLEPETVESLAAAAELYRGDFLSDFYLPDSAEFEAWANSRRALYRRRALEALGRLAGYHLEQGQYDRAAAYARRQLELDDLHEPAVRQLMLALAAEGQRSAALRVYEEAQSRLDEALQVVPSNETTALWEQIRAEQLPPGSVGPPAVTASEGAAPTVAHNLSRPATALVGRHSELAGLEMLLEGAGPERLLTILGPGGSGKTRLAVETALSQAAARPVRFPDGVWFVPLAALSEPEAVVAETAKALGFSFAGGGPEPRQQLLDYLRPRRLLLVLDNYEHLLTGNNRPLPADILATAPQVKVLVTSRTRLNVHGEQLFPLRGLAIPEAGLSAVEAAGYESVALFEQLGRQVQPGFTLDKETLPAAIRICRLVEGMPLAIEMAAAWLAALPAEAIAREIEHSLDVLAAEWQNVPARQRSLRAVFTSSWQMLDDGERQALQRLSVFRGGFEREAATAAAGASLQTLLSLTNKSWLVRESGDRYQIHELLRQYAYEALREQPVMWDEARDAHARYFAARLVRWNGELRGASRHEAGQKAALDALAVDFENVRHAWGWLVESGQTTAATKEMLPALVLFCSARSRESDLLAWVQQARAAGQAEPVVEALLLTTEAAFYHGYYAIRYFLAHFVSIPQPSEIISRAWQSLRWLEAGELDGLWLVLAGTLYGWAAGQQLRQEEASEAHQQLREWTTAFGEQGDRWAEAFAMANLGRLLSQLRLVGRAGEAGEGIDSLAMVEAQRLLSKAVTGFERLGDRLEHAHTLRLLGQHLLGRDERQAEQALAEARRLFLEMGDRQAAAHVMWSLAQQRLWLGQYERGFALFGEMVALYESLGSRQFMAFALSLESQEALRYSDVGHARRARLRSLALSQEIGDRLGTAWSLWELGEIERVAQQPETARSHYEAAKQMFDQLGDRFGLAFYYRGLGDLALAERDPESALIHFDRALQVNRDVGHKWTTAYLLGGLGRAARAQGDAAAARRYLRDAVRTAQLIGHGDLTVIALVDWAALEAADGRADRALALVGFVQSRLNTWREARDRAAQVAVRAAAMLDAETAAAAQARGESLTMAEAAAWVLEEQPERQKKQ